MNQRVFVRNLLGVTAIYGLALGVGIALSAFDCAIAYTTFKDLVPLTIAIPAAWLGYCFQRRQNYLKDVRDLWVRMVEAVQDAIQYTFLPKPSQPQYGATLRQLSVAIDVLRGVFANLGAESREAGLYPFESLKAIHENIKVLGFGDAFSPEAATTARSEILSAWKELRLHYLAELDRKPPAKVDSPFILKD